ncbi:MAG: 50S ribosomal protein L15e [Conexivisphaerales archaeon]
MYSYISRTYQQELKEYSAELRRRLIGWRRGPRVVRVDKPTRLDRARALGYKAKQGIVVLRVRVARGGMRMKRPVSGRRPKHLGTVKIKGNLSEKKVAIQRAEARYPNLWALGSYFLAKDGRFSWYEVVMVDPHHPAIRSDVEFKKRLPAKL